MVQENDVGSYKFRVAICGGGIGGLTAAVALAKNHDIRVDLYESAQAFNEIGAGVVVWPRPWGVLVSLGLEDDLKELAHVPDDGTKQLAFELRKADQPEGISFYDIYTPMGNPAFYRSAFQKSLEKHLNPKTTTCHFSKRLVSYTQPEVYDGHNPIILNFSDGSIATCDVLVGADGIYSITRRQLINDYAKEAKGRADELLDKVEAVWSGTVAYRGIISVKRLGSISPNHRVLTKPVNYVGKNKHIIVFPISHGTLLNVVAFVSKPEYELTHYEGNKVEARPKQELLDQYAGWEPEVITMLNCIDEPSVYVVNHLKQVPISVHRRVAILGDASHAMTPHQGSGAGQSIEDGYVLSAVLSHPFTTIDTLPQALKVYETVRLPQGNEVQKKSRETGHLYEFYDERCKHLAVENPDISSLRAIGQIINDKWEWAWTTSAEKDKDRAEEMLQALLEDQKGKD